MTDFSAAARKSVDELKNKNTDELYLELGQRLYAMQQDPSIGGSYSPELPAGIEALGATDDLKDFGQRFFKRVNAQAYALVCGVDAENSEERENVLDAFGVGKDAVAPAIAALLVLHLGMAPAISAVVATLILRVFFRPAYESMCEVWGEHQADVSG